jgi:hypothetical protein
MAANPNVGSEAAAGATETPNQSVSQAESKPIGDVSQLLSDFGGKLESITKELRGLQGRQDRSDGKFGDFQKQLARLAQYEKQGMSREEAIAEMTADDASEQRWTNLERKLDELATRIASGGTQASGQQAVAKVFEAIGLDLKDPRVAASLLKNYKDSDAVELEAYRLQRQLSESPNPTPAQAASMQGGGASGKAPDQKELWARYQAEVAQHRGNVLMVSDIQSKYRKEGLNV